MTSCVFNSIALIKILNYEFDKFPSMTRVHIIFIEESRFRGTFPKIVYSLTTRLSTRTQKLSAQLMMSASSSQQVHVIKNLTAHLAQI